MARLVFYSDDHQIGVSEINFIVAPEPGTPIAHSFTWLDAPHGKHELRAVIVRADGTVVSSEKVAIVVDPPLGLPEVTVYAAAWKTAEPNPLALIAPGVFVVQRTAPFDRALRVVMAYAGTATAEADYRPLPHVVEFAAGEQQKRLNVLPVADKLVEGLEVVSARVVPPAITASDVLPNYTVPRGQAAMVVIADEQGGPPARLDILDPIENARFLPDATIPISVLGVFVKGEIDGSIQFYAGDKRIGELPPLPFERPTIPCNPLLRTFEWKNAPEGIPYAVHSITARYELTPGHWITSPPVKIFVGSGTEHRVVSIRHIMTREAIPNADYAPGYFLIQRTGSTAHPLGVHISLGGEALEGIDYQKVDRVQVIPAGEESIGLRIQAIDDKLPEARESVVVRLEKFLSDDPSPWAYYSIDPDAASAELLMFDNDRASEIATLEIRDPKSGDEYGFGQAIRILAVAVDTLADIRRVEFYDRSNRIGVSEHLTRDAVIPGRPREHEFIWRGAALGGHKIYACALDSEGNTVISKPVEISISELWQPVTLAVITTDGDASEAPGADGNPNNAVFTIHRVRGPVDVGVTVYYSLAGAAANGVDYEKLSGQVLLPAGSKSVDVVIRPIPDKALEGNEQLLFTLEHPICPAIFPPPPWCYMIGDNFAGRAVIRDDGGHENLPPIVAILQPTQGAEFGLNQDILLLATASDPDGRVAKVEFFDGRVKIGEAVEDDRLGGPLPVFQLVWKDALPGKHLLTARATDTLGGVGSSAPVEISLTSGDERPVVTATAWDAHAVEPGSSGELNTATFQIHRTGPVSGALTVHFAMDGTATAGSDYENIHPTVEIPAGRSWVFVTVTPLSDDLRERSESVILRLFAPLGQPGRQPYIVGRPGSASAVISDRGWVLPPGYAHCVQLPGGLVHLCFAASEGTRHRIEASNDLLNWTTLAFATSIDGAAHYVDESSAAFDRRFYRAVAVAAEEDPGKN